MLKPEEPCTTLSELSKSWNYEQYYKGEKDEEDRKTGYGENNWTGAESLEQYTGHLLYDTMHGQGEYRWRYRGPDGIFATYEGHFYGNSVHGYGTMSYADGRVFTGLYHFDVRWGPGVETQVCGQEDVGLWRGNQLLRLVWKPSTQNVAIDLNAGISGAASVAAHRKLLRSRTETVKEINSAIEILKQYGSDPMTASGKWSKLYPKHCNDLASQLCNVKEFQSNYYYGEINILEEVSSCTPEVPEWTTDKDAEVMEPNLMYYAWNNNNMLIHMMKHCFKHENQRSSIDLQLSSVLNGPRNKFKQPGKHELDCRTLLMTSYLGHISNVAQLINENNVHPDVSDILGNNAIMYAACGDQHQIIHFLVEAGADIDSYNDCCCTPLGIVLLRFMCNQMDISAKRMVDCLTPLQPPPEDLAMKVKPLDWHILREVTVRSPIQTLSRAPSKQTTKQLKKASALKIDDLKNGTGDDVHKEPIENFAEEERLYNIVNKEFEIKVNDLFLQPNGNTINYVFQIRDMVDDIESKNTKSEPNKVETKKQAEKTPKKPLPKTSKVTISNSPRKELISKTSLEKIKLETSSRMMLTIIQLLSDGADPRLVRCPQPALLIAVISGSPELVLHICNHGVDIHEVYPEILGYTALDVAVSRPFTNENLEIIRILLNCGARTDHTLKYEAELTDAKDVPEALLEKVSGPTLLHAVLARTCENDFEKEIRWQLLELLLQYNCDPIARYKGCSSVDAALSNNLELLDLFIRHPRTNLNAEINDMNQTILVKTFSLPFFNTMQAAERNDILTNLLLYGADPLLPCQNEEDKYKNLIAFARYTLEHPPAPSPVIKPSAAAGKGKENDDKSPSKSPEPFYLTYKQALDFVVECARILFIRWLQYKLYKQLLDVVRKYKHRCWNMILPEHTNKRACGLWLSTTRCIEIWDLSKANKKRRSVDDSRVLRHLLCIIELYNKRNNIKLNRRVTTEERTDVETEVNKILRYRNDGSISSDMPLRNRPYVMPELIVCKGDKYNVCFECLLPFNEITILCSSCKMISFCSYTCMRSNTRRVSCHPCSEYLKNKFCFHSTEATLSE